MYMLAAYSTGDYSFVTSKYGMMGYDEIVLVADRLNERLEMLGSISVFYPTLVLDI